MSMRSTSKGRVADDSDLNPLLKLKCELVEDQSENAPAAGCAILYLWFEKGCVNKEYIF